MGMGEGRVRNKAETAPGLRALKARSREKGSAPQLHGAAGPCIFKRQPQTLELGWKLG